MVFDNRLQRTFIARRPLKPSPADLLRPSTYLLSTSTAYLVCPTKSYSRAGSKGKDVPMLQLLVRLLEGSTASLEQNKVRDCAIVPANLAKIASSSFPRRNGKTDHSQDKRTGIPLHQKHCGVYCVVLELGK